MSKYILEEERNQQIYKLFTEVTADLNKQAVNPIVYGSLGLYLLIGEQGQIGDIDLLISGDFEICKKVSHEHGFELDPAHPRELIGNGTYISFLDEKEIEDLAGHKLDKELVEADGVKFYNLSLVDYLDIYRNGLKNKYRKQKKEKDDLEKIELIKTFYKSNKK